MNILQKAIARIFGLSVIDRQQHVSASIYPQTTSMLSASGQSVTQDRALTLSAVWSCVKRISETISTMPLQVFEKLENGGSRMVGYEHPLYFILHDSPNADMTSTEFWTAMQCAVELQGNAYAAKQFVGKRLVGLDFLRPDRMSVRKLQNGTLEYRYSDGDKFTTYTGDEILHVKGMTLDGLQGLSTISYMRNTIGLGIAMETAASDLFKNGMRPSGIYNVPQKLSEEQRRQLRDRVEAFKSDRNGGVLVTALGEEFKAISISPEDSQLLSSRAWAVEEICRWFGVPPYLMGYTEKTTSWGTGMEQQNSAYLTYSILPRIRKIEQALEKALLSPKERRKYYIRFNYEGLLRADSKTRAEVNAMDVRNGIRTRNEVREKENMSPFTGGDVHTVEMNLTTLDNIIDGQNLKSKGNNDETKNVVQPDPTSVPGEGATED